MTETLIKILLFGTFSCVLLSLAIEDHRHNRLPNRLTIPLILYRIAIELDRHHQPVWVPLHLISRFSARRCHSATLEFGHCMKSSSTDQAVLASGWETQNFWQHSALGSAGSRCRFCWSGLR